MGCPVLPEESALRSHDRNMNARKRIGLIGCGVVAGYGHLPTLRESPDFKLHALYDPNEKNLRAAKEKFSVPHAFTDMDAFFQSGIEVVSITSPAPCHLSNVASAAGHGKHILCEKPLAMTEDEGREMMALTEKAGVLLCVGFDYRFSPVAMKIRELVTQRAVGDVRSLRLVNIWNMHGKYVVMEDGRRVEQARRVARMLDCGPMVDCGVHQIDLARWWLQSEVIRWTSAGAWVDEYEVPDHVYVHMDHENGAHTMVDLSYSYCHTAAEPVNYFTYELIGTEGVIRFELGTKLLVVRNSSGTQQMQFGTAKNFAGMYAAFARTLKTGDWGDLPRASDGLIAIRIARGATNQVMKDRIAPGKHGGATS